MLTGTTTRALGALAIGGLALLGGIEPAGAAPPRASRVVIVSVPGLTWRDLQRDQPPTLLDVAARGAVASTSLRTVGPTTTPAEAYLTMGAGTRALAPGLAATVLLPDAAVGTGMAADAAARRTGASMTGAVAVVPGMPEVQRANDRSRYGSDPGLLGRTLAAHGRTMAVIGNAAAQLGAQQLDAGLAAVDGVGRIARGQLDDGLLLVDPGAAEGVRMDPAAVERAFTTADDDVVLVELSDVWRATRFTPTALPDAAVAERAEALAATDALLARLLTHVGPADLLLLVAPVAPPVQGSDQLTVGMLAGPGVEPGLLRSGTTRRSGYVTLPDIAPTVLRALGIGVPTAMAGAPMASDGQGPAGAATVRDLIVDNKQALFRNRATGPLTVSLIVVQVLGYAAAAVALARGRHRWHRALLATSLVTASVPIVAYLSGLLPYRVLGVPGYVAAVFAGAGVLAAAALGIARLAARRGVVRAHLVAPMVVAGLTAGTLLVDVVLGAPLQVATPFGYGGGPLVAGRFAGYGNLATGLLAQALLVGVTAWWGTRRRGPDRLLVGAMAVLFAAGVVAIGAPQLGQDVGGVLSVLPAFVLITLLAAGVSLTGRRIALTAGGTIGVLVAFGGLDLLRPPEQRTHLGRLFALLADRGPGALVEVVDRKLHSNLHALTTSVWGVAVIAGVVFVAWLGRERLSSLAGTTPGVRLFLVGTALLAGLGFALNDSGIAIPGFMLVLALPYVTYLTLHTAEG